MTVIPIPLDASNLEKIKGNVTLFATNNITILPSLNFIKSSGTITLQADSDNDGLGGVTLQSDIYAESRNIVISGSGYITGYGVINTSSIDGNAGSIKVTSTNADISLLGGLIARCSKSNVK